MNIRHFFYTFTGGRVVCELNVMRAKDEKNNGNESGAEQRILNNGLGCRKSIRC